MFQVLGDIGGFNDIFTIGFAFLLSFYSVQAFEGHISSHTEFDHSTFASKKKLNDHKQNNLLSRIATGQNAKLK